ncbi:MAG: hypothetical protein FJ207_01605 [Gemmatimonadetes bacterium]|nr:hypothetical protein [Gemmatimonadota bacterium]
MTRAEAATTLCRRLGAEVENIAPANIELWSETWDIVGDADVSYVIALTTWETTGAEEDRAKVRDAYQSVLEAWRKAARRYQRQVA